MYLPYFDLRDKVAIISGGGTGIGKGIAEALAEAGATIVIASRSLARCEQACGDLQERVGATGFPHRCDVTSSSDIQNLVNHVIEKFGHIDILVNNAGISGSEKPILKMTEEDWDTIFDTNLKGVFMLSRAVVKEMVERGNGGKVINVGSIGAIIAVPNTAGYCTSKGACVQVTKVMALEWVRYNIQVNAVVLGYFDTPMNREVFLTERGRRLMETRMPMKRLAKVDEIKGVAVLLASEASSFMTGSAVVIDGGYTCR
jgi:NAD(P)-dependent dehydrogenase (short-subunit alcohol dehydrogenase family)